MADAGRTSTAGGDEAGGSDATAARLRRERRACVVGADDGIDGDDDDDDGDNGDDDDDDDDAPATDLFQLAPADALELLGASVELLVRMTGDVPPTPAAGTRTDPQMSGMQAEKDQMARWQPERRRLGGPPRWPAPQHASCRQEMDMEIDGVHLRQRRQPAAAGPTAEQHGAMTRRFYSKEEPAISIRQYLARLHQFCPMSTGVYLATSLYMHRLAVDEGAMAVTRRNAHRLVLAGLRVATKALEDRAHPQARVARVGGVSAAELLRLEVGFCFLAGFELVVGAASLRRHWAALRLRRGPRDAFPT